MMRDAEARDVIRFAIESEFKCEVVTAGSVTRVIDTLLEGELYDLLVLEMYTQSSKLVRFLLSVDSNAPLILLQSKDAPSIPGVDRMRVLATLQPENAVAGIRAAIKQSNLNAKVTLDGDPSEFVRIQTTLLMKMVPLDADVFIRLSPKKYLRIFQSGDVFSAEDLERYYLKKNIPYFYCRVADRHVCLNKLKAIVQKKLTEGIQPRDVPGLVAETADILFEVMDTEGMTPEVVSFAQTSISAVIQGVRLRPQLSGLLDGLDMAKGTYRATHSALLAHVASVIGMRLNWVSNSTLEKLGFAALFHDSTLKSDELVKIETPEECDEIGGYQREIDNMKQIVLNHPLMAAEVIRKAKDLPPEIDMIIAQHHERPDGTGFPNKINHTQIAPLSALFIVAHEIVRLHLDKKLTVKEILVQLPGEYKQGVFKQIIQALRTMTDVVEV